MVVSYFAYDSPPFPTLLILFALSSPTGTVFFWVSHSHLTGFCMFLEVFLSLQKYLGIHPLSDLGHFKSLQYHCQPIMVRFCLPLETCCKYPYLPRQEHAKNLAVWIADIISLHAIQKLAHLCFYFFHCSVLFPSNCSGVGCIKF